MERYTLEQRILIVKIYYQNGENFTASLRKIRAAFPRNRAPSETAVRKLIAKFKARGTVADNRPKQYARSGRSDANIAAVQQSVEHEPETSIRRRSQQLGITRGTLRNILHKDLYATSRNISMSLTDISIKFTEATCEEIIKKAGGSKYTSYKFGKGFKKGDSYLSKVFRLCIYGIDETTGENVAVNLIVKGMPDNVARRKVFRSAEFFSNEINFYLKVIPAWETFQKKQNPKNPFNEYPICYAVHCDGENDFIALQDVSFLGYGAPNRQDYISLDECLLTMRTLGRFHGISLAFHNLEPKEFEKTAKALQETYYRDSLRKWYMDFFKLACSVAKDAISKTFPNTEYETISGNFLQETLYDDLINLVSTRSKLSVFGHGDCWTPNFLTRYGTDGKAEAIKIIDFQLARVASVVVDLSFFIYSCTSQALREQHYDTLLKAYHESATNIINDLGADAEKVMSWQDLVDELKLFGRFGCGMGIESVPMSLIDDDEVADLDEITENTVLTDVWNIKPFKEPAKRQRIADIFKHAIDQGYIK